MAGVAPGNAETEPSSGYERLDTQITWYDQKSMAAQRSYRRTKIVELSAAALVPFVSPIQGIIGALLGAVVIVLEGVQQLSQWHQNWITFRSTCEALRHEKYTYLARAGVYDGLDDPSAKKVLAERVESLISTEHAKWISRQEYEVKKAGQQMKKP